MVNMSSDSLPVSEVVHAMIVFSLSGVLLSLLKTSTTLLTAMTVQE